MFQSAFIIARKLAIICLLASPRISIRSVYHSKPTTHALNPVYCMPSCTNHQTLSFCSGRQYFHKQTKISYFGRLDSAFLVDVFKSLSAFLADVSTPLPVFFVSDSIFFFFGVSKSVFLVVDSGAPVAVSVLGSPLYPFTAWPGKETRPLPASYSVFPRPPPSVPT